MAENSVRALRRERKGRDRSLETRGRMGSGPVMAAEEADVDVEGDVVPAAAQPG